MKLAYSAPLTFQVRADLFNHLAAMEKSGLPVDKAIGLLRLPGTGQARVEKLRNLMSLGVDIATAGERSGTFTPLEASVLRSALYSGSTATTYRRLADHCTQQARQIAAIRSRLRLPGLIFVLALLLQPLPGLVGGSISGGGYLLQVLRPLSLLLALFYLTRWLRIRFQHVPPAPTQAWLARQLTQVPVFGAMHVRRNNRDFFVGMALLLEAGVPMFDALPKAVKTIGNCVIREEFSQIEPQMRHGATLAQAVNKLGYVGNMQVTGYIQTGEASGTVPEMLMRFTNAETSSITNFQQQVAAWLPRVVYGLVMMWMAYGIFTGSAFMPHMPKELQ